ncbi:hypothetical protein HMN09_00809700 [Mycena chlorophos]|uniref:TRAPPC10/Trs130 N-terminal domain-containing protein n=1 Tax=Mycena chlorophos TaxID=658473 RepID=A0A8H6SUY2_MYCCL|nr:hypothetical protein HMN09_00809700 [Mycena chlorophos]
MGPPQRVLVSYSGVQSYLASPHWDTVRTALLAQLPLRNIHWKSANRTSLRPIQELNIALVPLESLRDEHTSQVPAALLEKPFLNIYIVTCDDSDLEGYKNTIKRQVKDLHTVVSAKKNEEWVILHVVRPDARLPSGNFFQLKGSVLDKLKSDFNSDKRDRCVQLSWASGYTNPDVWAEFLTKLKDGILSSFDAAITQREEEVKRSENQRQMPGWNFCTYFILKESLAEASFYQVLKERNLLWFGALIIPAPNDDSAPLLAISKKPYRDLILSNTISAFDLRIYLLARQCEILASMGRLTEVGNKTAAFLGAFGRWLREVEDSLPQYFLESWTYCSALSVVDQCDSWSTNAELQGPKLNAFNASKGELVELARTQLDLIGVQVGHLPVRPHFCNAAEPPSSGAFAADKSLSSQELMNALGNREKFYETYVGIMSCTIDMYTKAGRRKFALNLHGSLVALDVHCGRLAEVLAPLPRRRSHLAHYTPHH